MAGSRPKWMPPCLTFGHETFSSRAVTPPARASLSERREKSSTDSAKMFANTVTPASTSAGRASETKRSTPTLASPIALSMPDGVSQILGGGFPALGSRLSPLVQTAPSLAETEAGWTSWP